VPPPVVADPDAAPPPPPVWPMSPDPLFVAPEVPPLPALSVAGFWSLRGLWMASQRSLPFASRCRFAARARAIPFFLSLRTWSALRSLFDAALLSAAAAESPMSELFPEREESELFAALEESELFAEIDESELFAEIDDPVLLELSELCGIAAVLDELEDCPLSSVFCASLVAESFCVLPRFTCANAGAAPRARAARIAILICSS
jgi:hypothetical protein